MGRDSCLFLSLKQFAPKIRPGAGMGTTRVGDALSDCLRPGNVAPRHYYIGEAHFNVPARSGYARDVGASSRLALE